MTQFRCRKPSCLGGQSILSGCVRWSAGVDKTLQTTLRITNSGLTLQDVDQMIIDGTGNGCPQNPATWGPNKAPHMFSIELDIEGHTACVQGNWEFKPNTNQLVISDWTT